MIRLNTFLQSATSPRVTVLLGFSSVQLGTAGVRVQRCHLNFNYHFNKASQCVSSGIREHHCWFYRQTNIISTYLHRSHQNKSSTGHRWWQKKQAQTWINTVFFCYWLDIELLSCTNPFNRESKPSSSVVGRYGVECTAALCREVPSEISARHRPQQWWHAWQIHPCIVGSGLKWWLRDPVSNREHRRTNGTRAAGVQRWILWD